MPSNQVRKSLFQEVSKDNDKDKETRTNSSQPMESESGFIFVGWGGERSSLVQPTDNTEGQREGKESNRASKQIQHSNNGLVMVGDDLMKMQVSSSNSLVESGLPRYDVSMVDKALDEDDMLEDLFSSSEKVDDGMGKMDDGL